SNLFQSFPFEKRQKPSLRLKPLAAGLLRGPVHYEYFAKGTDHDISRFQIAMKNASCVRERHGIADAEKEPQALRQGVHLLNVFVESLAFDEFHCVKHATIRKRADVMHGNDARVFELREDACFANQTRCELFARVFCIEDL